jgi:sugar lactone lactonase YvrE
MSTPRLSTLPSPPATGSPTTRHRGALRWAALSVLTLGLLLPAAAPADARPRDHRTPDVIALPDGFQPEGITIDQRGRDKGTAYFGSRADGDIYAADLRTGEGRVISQGPGTPSVGLKTDSQGLLYVSGGRAGDARVVDVRSGRVLVSYALADPAPTTERPSFVNDVVLARRDAWFTDSNRAVLYRVPLAKHGRTAPASAIQRLPLTGEWTQTAGVNNANGIAVSPDGRSLLVVQSNTGFLFRVDPRTGVATKVDLGGTLLTNGDGLLVEGRTLYAVQNRLNQVAVVRLDRSGSSGRLQTTLTDADFDVPTTIASYGKSLYLPNARFSTPPTPTTTYTAVRIDRP